MAKFNWKEISREDVDKAISIFEADTPDYPEPRSTFLLFNGKRYPAKHIRGMAYKVHFEQEISKNDFAGGQETVNFFKRLGFETQYTHKSISTHPVKKDNSQFQNKSNNKADTLNIKTVEEKSILTHHFVCRTSALIEYHRCSLEKCAVIRLFNSFSGIPAAIESYR